MAKTAKSERFFTAEEKERIKAATQQVEARTVGEVAVMLVDSSDRYHEAEVMGGIFLGSLLALAATVAFFHSSLWTYIVLSFLFFIPSKYLFQKVPAFKAAFVGVRRMEDTVAERAVRAFYEKGLYRTRENTGVLFFLSLFERKVWVLADKGIYTKIDQDTLNTFAGAVAKGIKEGRAADALCEAIRQSGDILEKHFPIKPGDINELPDGVMTE